MRRRLILSAVLSSVLALAASGPASANPSLLIDANTNRVIESDNPFQRWYPASLTKLMTAYVAFRAVAAGEVSLKSPVIISKKAAAQPPSKMGYPVGSELTLDNALKIIMVKSANDVAAAIGESIAGSQKAFADRMNAESARLGMTDSHWVNAHGLHDDDQYTTVRDLVVLSTALRREFPQYGSYFSIEGLQAGDKVLPSHNNLIGRFDGADGMKTGYTCPSGYNLVASATRGGRTLLAIVVGSETVKSRDEKAAAMLARGFAFSPSAGQAFTELKPSGTEAAKPVNMREELCTKKAREARAKAEKERKKAEKELAKSGKEKEKEAAETVYLGEMTRARVLVKVELGGATGPLSPAAAALAAANRVYADVPIPTWRPDKPAPGTVTAQQGDDAS
jgi:D-alanyl-D-alanine carboxypeptidase